MNSKSDTIDAELNGILKDYRQVLTQQMGLILSGRHRLDIKIADNVLLDEAKAKLKSLLLRERIDGITECWTSFAENIDPAKLDSFSKDKVEKAYNKMTAFVAELSRLSREESHE